MGESKMLERIWAWNAPGSGWNDRMILNEVRTTAYIRADLVDEMAKALERADQFITNGIELGFIRMPDKGCPDPAHQTPGIVHATLYRYRAAVGDK